MAETVELKVPDIGDFDEVDVIEVLVSPGDRVEKEQSLITLESDKATMEVPSSHDGVIKEIKVSVGDKVSAGMAVATAEIAEAGSEPEEGPALKEPETAAVEEAKGDAVAAGEAEPKEPLSEPPVSDRRKKPRPAPQPLHLEQDHEPFTPLPVDAQKKAHASPAIRRFARELGVPLSEVEGSGRRGRILKEDVQAFTKQVMHERGRGAPSAPAAGGGIPPVPPVDFSKFGEVERVDLPRIKRISGPHLQRSWLNVPHVTQFDQADITELEAFRKEEKARADKEGAKLTPLAFLVKASAAALRRFPDFNSSLAPEGDALIVKKYVHIGVAVDTPNGLVVPVIRDADRKGIYDIARDLGELSAKARDGKLSPGDMQGGCFSISSLGGIGGTAFTPIVNAPEVAILGVSRSEMKPVWNGSEFVPRLMLPLSLSYDHRVIDGAAAARFTTYLGEVLGDIRRLVL